MTCSPVLILHIAGGLAAVVTGFTALFVRKGSRLHRRSGDVFVISMLTMAAGGAYVALMKSQPANVIAGLFTIYLVSSALTTVMRREKQTGRVEAGLLVLALVVGAAAMILGWKEKHPATGAKPGSLAVMFYVFGSVALLAAGGDIRMLIRGGVSGARRMVRHVWRMGLALFIATTSFFIGTAGDPVLRKTGLRARLFTDAVRKTHLPTVPVLIVVVLTIFWLCRIWFTNVYKRPSVISPN